MVLRIHRITYTFFGMDPREVEGVEILMHRKRGILDPRLEHVGGTCRHLQLREPQQVLLATLVGGGGFPGQLLKLRMHGRQPQLLQVGLDQQGIRFAHGSPSGTKVG